MPGLGRTLVRGLGAAMQGYGKTLLDQDAQRQKDADAQALLLREQALASFRHGLDLDTVTATGATNVAVHAANERTDTNEKLRALPAQTQAKVIVDRAQEEAKFQMWRKQQPIEFHQKLTLQQQREAFEMAKQHDEQGFQRTQQEDRQQHDLDTNPIGTMVAADGTPVAFFAQGARNRYTKMEGTHMPARSADGGSDDLSAYRPGGTAAVPAGTTHTVLAATAPDYSVYRSMLAESAMHPEFKDMSAAERIAAVKALAQRQNIPIPPGE